MNDTTYVGMRYVPVFAEPSQWDISRQYENLMMVTNEGETYISKEFVPTGVELTNEDYWVKISVPSGNSGGGEINYSTEEQDTGLLWIDGRHIYQKTYSQVLNDNMSNGSTWYAMNDLNGKEIIGNETFYKSGSMTISGIVDIQGPNNAGVGSILTSINLSSGGTLTSTIRYVKTSEIV